MMQPTLSHLALCGTSLEGERGVSGLRIAVKAQGGEGGIGVSS